MRESKIEVRDLNLYRVDPQVGAEVEFYGPDELHLARLRAVEVFHLRGWSRVVDTSTLQVEVEDAR